MLNAKLRERLRRRRNNGGMKNVASGKWKRRNAKLSRSASAGNGKRSSSRRGGRRRNEIVKPRRNGKPRRGLQPLPDVSNRRKRNVRRRLVRRRGPRVNVLRRRRSRRRKRRKLVLLNNLANRTLAPLLHLATLPPLARLNVRHSLRPPQRKSSTSRGRQTWSLLPPYFDKTRNLVPLSSPTNQFLKLPRKRRTLPHPVIPLALTEPLRSKIL